MEFGKLHDTTDFCLRQLAMDLGKPVNGAVPNSITMFNNACPLNICNSHRDSVRVRVRDRVRITDRVRVRDRLRARDRLRVKVRVGIG